MEKYQPSGEGGARSPPAKSKMADGVWKDSKQLSLNKFFDPCAPSMRKVDDGEKKEKREYQPNGAL